MLVGTFIIMRIYEHNVCVYSKRKFKIY